jgi:coenzyme F420-reducing hydrogenase alpha subunit
MTSPPEGVIRIELCAGPGAGTARIENLRPLSISSRFSGRKPAEVASLVPLVYSICRAAQSAASEEALEAALAIAPDARKTAVRELRILAETAREHALQVLHAWPQCLRAPQPALAPASIKRLLKIDGELSRCLGRAAPDTAGLFRAIEELTALLGEAVFAELPGEWLSRRDPDALSCWAQRSETLAQSVIEDLIQNGMADAGAAEIAPLPQARPKELLDILLGENAASFVARPEWEGQPREATPLARLLDRPLVDSIKDRHGYGLLARLCACLIELAEAPGRMLSLAASLNGSEAPLTPTLSPRGEGAGCGLVSKVEANSCVPSPLGERDRVRGSSEASQHDLSTASGRGLGAAEAARGRLVHAVEVADGLVRRYRILAPTEWNFHPEGAAARGLAQIANSAPAQREWLARLFITAVDPCVGYDLRLS